MAHMVDEMLMAQDVMDLDGEADAEWEPEEEEDAGDEDTIVKEVDVYFAQELADSLYLFQYPTRPHSFDDITKPTTGRIKPKSKRFELEIPLQTRGQHYSRERGEELGHGTDNAPIRGMYDSDDETPAKLLDKQTLSSSLLPSNANYMVGLVKHGDELHLTPINTAIQLRPSLFYIDKITEKQNKRHEEDTLEANKRANPEYEEEAKVLSVTIKGPEDKEAIRKAAQEELRRKAEEEAWLPLSIHHTWSPHSRALVEKLYSDSPNDVDFSSNQKSYLDEINPSLSAVKLDDGVKLKQGYALRDIRLLPVRERIKALLINAHIVNFHTLFDLCPEVQNNQDELLQAITAAGVLVKGVWIVRSELLYTDHALDARRYLLYMFQLSPYVSRKVFADYTRLPGEMATNMLSEIAVLEHGKGWALKIPSDNTFVSHFEDVVLEQAAIVHEEGERARATFEVKSIPSKAIKKADPKKASVPRGQTNKKELTTTELLQTLTITGNSMQEQLDGVLYQLLTIHTVCSLEYITLVLLARASVQEAGNKLTSITAERIAKAVQNNCIALRENLFVRKVFDGLTDQEHQMRDAVIALFKSKDMVLKKEANAAVKAAVGKEMSLGPYTKIMNELAGIRGAGKWYMKKSPVWDL